MINLHSSIQTAFDTMSTAGVRYLAFQLYVSWLRNITENAFGVVGTSTVGNSLVRGDVNVVTPVDLFTFQDESENVISLEYDRAIDEPLGGISYSIANVTLDNTDKRFTPDFNSTIGTAILPNRPIKMMMGFVLSSTSKQVSVFKGLTSTVKENKELRQVEFSGFDYVSYLNDLTMDSAMYTDQRSDEIIEQVLIEAGLGSSQYSLDEGLNTIGYAWFSKEQTAGERIRQICEAEEGNFFQDEYGIIRFENRRKYNLSPYNSAVWTFNDNDILEWEQDNSVEIINKCIVKGSPRKAGDNTEIWRDGIVEGLEKGETKEIWATFENPCISLDDLVAGTDYTANTVSDGSGSDVSSSVTVSLDAFTDTAKLTIVNNSGSTCFITLLRIMGTPAVITSQVLQIYEDTDSVTKYNKRLLEIENDFIDNDSFAYYLARAIVTKYKSPLRQIRIRVRGIPHLQLKDKVSVYDRDLGEYKSYRVVQIQGIMSGGAFEQILRLREVTDYETDSWAVVGSSLVSSETEVVGI